MSIQFNWVLVGFVKVGAVKTITLLKSVNEFLFLLFFTNWMISVKVGKSGLPIISLAT